MINFFINWLVYSLILNFCLVWFAARIRSFNHWFILVCSFLYSVFSTAGSLLSFYYKKLAVDVRCLFFLWRAAWCILGLWFLMDIIDITSLDWEIQLSYILRRLAKNFLNEINFKVFIKIAFHMLQLLLALRIEFRFIILIN